MRVSHGLFHLFSDLAYDGSQVYSFRVSKKRPRKAKRSGSAAASNEVESRLDAGFWQQRLFRNTFTYKGRTRLVNAWSVKIQLFGRRKSFTLASSRREEAAAEACDIYQTIQMQGWDGMENRRTRTNLLSRLAAREAEHAAIESDVENWKRRLIQRRYPEPGKHETVREFSARIEHAGISRYFPLGTTDENAAAARAMMTYRTVVNQGWAAANQRFAREVTIAMRWLDDPLAWTYTTLHTLRSGTRRPPLPSVFPGPGLRKCGVLDPDPGIRFALAAAVDSQDGFSCVAVYANAAEAEREITRQQIDFIAINYSLPDQPGTAALAKLQHIRPSLAGLLHSVYEDSDELFKATPGGATGYMLKRTPSYKIFEPIADVQPPLARELVATRIREYFQRLIAAMPSGFVAVEIAKLTPREQEVLALLARGYVAKEIADTLGISIWTVHGHIKSVFEKLGVHTRTEAVVKFLQK
jgi:DNA-binding NarL/FixJ family response regulator